MTTTLFSNGAIHTGVEEEQPHWVLVDGARIVSVGTNSHDAPRADRNVDLGGGALIPAFCDAHVHLPATGLYAAGMDFRGEKSADAIVAAFAQRAESEGALLFGGNFEDPLDRVLGAEDLDRAVGDRPALLARADMHSCVASTALVAELDLDRIEGVDRDESGRPTGYLRERAAAEAWRWFDSRLEPAQQKEAVHAAARIAYSKGVSTVHEMFVVEWRGWHSYDVLRAAIEPLSLRVLTYLGTDDVDRVVSVGESRIGGDYFLDGAFGSHTAWMAEPYETTPPSGSSPTGISYRSDQEVFEFFLAAQRAGLQVGVHAIGDAAIDQCLTAWEKVKEIEGWRAPAGLGHRIEHFECATDDHIKRAAHLPVFASVQPAFDAFWGGEEGMYAQRIGPRRAAQMNRFKSMVDAGIVVAAGSDSTVTPLDPLLQMKALRLHHVAEERLDAPSALGVHTTAGHILGRSDGSLGTIEPGRLADLAWLSGDPITTPAEALTEVEVLGTWIDGSRVWPDSEAEAS